MNNLYMIVMNQLYVIWMDELYVTVMDEIYVMNVIFMNQLDVTVILRSLSVVLGMAKYIWVYICTHNNQR